MDRIKSVINGRDPDVLDAMFGFYVRPRGPVLDVTANERRMWKGLVTEGVTFCDIDGKFHPDVVCDYRQLPFPDHHASVIVFDPPHLPVAAASEKSDARFAEMYGLAKSTKGVNIGVEFPKFLVEAERVLMEDGLVFVKLCDYVHSHQYRWILVDFVNAVRATERLTATDLIVKCDPAAGKLMSSTWERAMHARRSHCWWIVVRKGPCEPRMDYPAQSVGRKVGV